MDNKTYQLTMVIATAVIAVVAVFGFFFGAVNPQLRDLRQELRDTRQEMRDTRQELRQDIKDSAERILLAIEKSEERMLRALAEHRHDDSGQVMINLPK